MAQEKNIQEYDDEYLKSLSLEEIIDLESKTHDAKVQCWLGDIYNSGETVPTNVDKAFEWYQKSAEQSYVKGMEKLGYMYSEGLGCVFSVKKAMKWYEKAGTPEGLWYIGEIYRDGNSYPSYKIPTDKEKAESYFQKALALYQEDAEQGDPDAMWKLANTYGHKYGENNGIFKPKEPAKAKKWLKKYLDYYQKSAEEGNLVAMRKVLEALADFGKLKEAREWYQKLVDLGDDCVLYYPANQCIPGKEKEAFEIYKKFADRGSTRAMSLLAIFFYGNYETSYYDEDKALELYLKVAELGDAHAQRELGDAYANKLSRWDVPKDYKKAIEWYQKAAEQGDKRAQTALGEIYYYGEDGVPQDYEKAFKWFQLAADQGWDQAQTALGRMYEFGQYVTKDYEKALELLKRASANGDGFAKSDLATLKSIMKSMK